MKRSVMQLLELAMYAKDNGKRHSCRRGAAIFEVLEDPSGNQALLFRARLLTASVGSAQRWISRDGKAAARNSLYHICHMGALAIVSLMTTTVVWSAMQTR